MAETRGDRKFMKGAVITGAVFLVLLALLMAWGDRTSESPSPTGSTDTVKPLPPPAAPTQTRPPEAPVGTPTVPTGPK